MSSACGEREADRPAQSSRILLRSQEAPSWKSSSETSVKGGEHLILPFLLVPVVSRGKDCGNHCRTFNILKTTMGLPPWSRG